MGTLVVNLLGCFLAGLLSYLMFERFLLSQTTRTVLLIGLLGGFTTFSSFGLQSFNMLRDGLTKYHLQKPAAPSGDRREEEGPEIAATQPQPDHHRRASEMNEIKVPLSPQKKGKER